MILYSFIIIFTVLIISLYGFFILGNSFFVTFGYAWLGVLYEIILNSIIAIVFGKLVTSKIFNKDSKFYKTTKFELKFYNFIKIKKWKDKVLELGIFGGFRKNKLKDTKDQEYLNKFILEINKGIVVHFISIFICVFILIIPPLINLYYITIPIIIVAIVLNLLPLFVLKFIRPKMLKLKEYNQKRNKA